MGRLVIARKKKERVYIDVPQYLGGIPTGVKHRITVGISEIQKANSNREECVRLMLEGPDDVIFTREELDHGNLERIHPGVNPEVPG